jgi:hypothetical protein
MSKILKNTIAFPIFVSDTGVSISGLSSYTIPEQDYLLWAASSNVVSYIGDGTLVVNDGSFDLSISNGVDLVKGLFPSKVLVNQSGTTLIEYSEVTSVASGIETIVVTKTTAVAKKLTKIVCGGSNIALFTLNIDGAMVAKCRTNFGSLLANELDFGSGIDVASGKTIELKVLHSRPYVGDFEGSLIFIKDF